MVYILCIDGVDYSEGAWLRAEACRVLAILDSGQFFTEVKIDARSPVDSVQYVSKPTPMFFEVVLNWKKPEICV